MDMAAFLSLTAGVTQMVKVEFKKRGVKLGNWTSLISFALGGTGIYMMLNQPIIWSQIAPVLLLFAAPGGVSLVKEVARK